MIFENYQIHWEVEIMLNTDQNETLPAKFSVDPLPTILNFI